MTLYYLSFISYIYSYTLAGCHEERRVSELRREMELWVLNHQWGHWPHWWFKTPELSLYNWFMHTVLCLKYIPKSSSFLCSLLLKGLFLLMLSFRAWILNLPLVCLKCLRRKCTALEHFPVPTERSGTVLTIMGTPLEHLFLPRSAEQSGTVMTMMGQCSGAISIPVARSRTGKDEMYKRPVFCGVIHHCNTERERGKMYRGTYASVLGRYPSL